MAGSTPPRPSRRSSCSSTCPSEAVAILDANEEQTVDEAQRSRWLAIRHITAQWGLGDTGTVEDIDRQAHKLNDLRERSLVLAVESTMRLHRGDNAQALTLARQVLDSAASAPGPRALARSNMGQLQAMRGTPVQTVKAMAAIDADAAQWRAEVPYIQLGIELARGTAMILAADLEAVDAIVAAEFAGMADAGNFNMGSGYLQIVRAQAARLRGPAARGRPRRGAGVRRPGHREGLRRPRARRTRARRRAHRGRAGRRRGLRDRRGLPLPFHGMPVPLAGGGPGVGRGRLR